MKAVVIIVAILVIPGILVSAPVENVISFQGKVIEGGTPVTGNRNILFKIYNVASGGTALWTENHLAVPVVGGLFNVELGGSVPFAGAGVTFDQQYWIGISVSGGAEITPRYKINGAAYSIGPWTNDAGDIYRETGNVGIGSSSPMHKLYVEQMDEGHAIYGFTGAIVDNNFGVVGAQSFSTSWGALGGYSPESFDVGVYGAQGTGDYAGYFDGAVFLDGQIKITGGSPGTGKVLTSDATGLASWQTPSGGSNWTLSGGNVYRSSGNVGIGTSSPSEKLHVQGNVHITGDVSTPEYSQHALPTAFGAVGSDGTLYWCSDNVTSCTWNPSSQYYELRIDGIPYPYVTDYSMTVTPNSSSPLIATVADVSDYFIIYIHNLDGDRTQSYFHFQLFYMR